MTYNFKDVSVLIVDSAPAMVKLISDILQMFGIQKIHTSTDGSKALTLFEKLAPDMVIADWDLASMDGLAFAKAVRASPYPYTPILFMTSFSSSKRVSAARDAGVSEFLKKPFSAESLYRRLEALVEKPRPFVRAPEFFGPDRRRRDSEAFEGPNKRDE